ncbi:MAG: class I SAM-dependent methyltransferase [Victivallales bacterium]
MDYEKGAPYNQQQEKFVRKLKKAYHKKNILPLLLQKFPPSREISILEFGPGLGVLGDLLYEYYPHLDYTILDISPDILNWNRARHANVKTAHICSPEELSRFLSDKKFDAVIALDVWEHIPDANLDAYTGESLKCLNSGGVFIAQVPNWACPFAPNIVFAGDMNHYNRFNEVSARQLLIKNGADNKNIKILPYVFPTNNFLNFFRRLIRPICLIFYKFTLFLLGLQILKVCTPNLIMLTEKK